MRRRVALAWGFVGTATIATTAFLISCLDDPRSGEKFVGYDNCEAENFALLSTEPKSVDATIRVFVETTGKLLEAVNKADAEMRDACLAIISDPDLGLQPPLSATTGAAACQPLLAYIQETVKSQPQPPGLNVIPQWIELRFGQRCLPPIGSKEACLSTCGDPCDVTKCDNPRKVVGTCPGACLGTCETTVLEDGGAKCHGNCVGIHPILAKGNPAFPGATCFGECEGTCAAPIYTGNCEGSCASDFTGKCGGTCTGTCNGAALPAPPPADGGLDGSLAPQDPNGPPSDHAPGNCGTGTCVGKCSKKAYGTCFARCVDYQIVQGDGGAGYATTLAKFSGGQCTESVCVGTCRSAIGTGASQPTGNNASPEEPGFCTGECTQVTQPKTTGLTSNTACTGTCRPDPNADAAAPFCDVDLDPASRVCEGKLACNQNIECSNACEAKAALDAVCADPLVTQAFAVTVPGLYAALQRHGLALGRAVAKLRQAQAAYSFLGGRRFGDFYALGARGDLAFVCANKGEQNLATANAILSADVAADPTTVRYLK